MRKPQASRMKPEVAPTRAPFDIISLQCKELMELLRETTSYIQGVKIEIVHEGRNPLSAVASSAYTIGLNVHDPTIRFSDSLDRQQRIEAIAHELAHFVLLYRFGLRLVLRKFPRPGDFDRVFKYFVDMRKNWFYLLGQIGNTIHHLFLIDYLKEEYGIESKVHLHLLHHNFCIPANEDSKDMESLYAKGVIAFEYDRLIGKVDRMVSPDHQPELFWNAYNSTKEHFGEYHLSCIPTPSNHETNVFSFLNDLGYEREDFTLFP